MTRRSLAVLVLAVPLHQACRAPDPRDDLRLLDDAAERDRQGIWVLWQGWIAERDPWASFVVREDGAVEAKWRNLEDPGAGRPGILAAAGGSGSAEGPASSARGTLTEDELRDLRSRIAELPEASYQETPPAGASPVPPIFRPVDLEAFHQGVLLVRVPGGAVRRYACFPHARGELGSPPAPRFRSTLVGLRHFFHFLRRRLEEGGDP